MTDDHNTITVGELVVRFLEASGVETAFGVISIHNMPILDVMGQRGKIHFVAARGEAGAVNMADAYARVRGHLGVAFTSTGTAAGNAAGAMVEALTAGTPLLHITGQVEAAHVGRDRAYIHEAPAQPDMLRAVSKTAYLAMTPEQVLPVLQQAASDAMRAPTGPISVEIPIDVQQTRIPIPGTLRSSAEASIGMAPTAISALAQRIEKARRPLLLVGGGARAASEQATQLADRGMGVVTSTQGRAIVPEDHPHSLGAFNVGREVEALYAECDLMVIVGSRLRSNETWTYKLKFPDQLVVIDIDPRADRRVYPNQQFLRGDAVQVLDALLAELPAKLTPEAHFLELIKTTRSQLEAKLREGMGPYTAMVDELARQMPRDALWVRDVTISNSTWGNRYLKISHPRNGVHALGGGIGQGIPMAVGAAAAAGQRKTLLLAGDGGSCLCIGELFTAADEHSDVTILLMNDAGYGVIRNIQDDIYGARRHYADILIPDFSKICASVAMPHWKVSDLKEFPAVLAEALAVKGPTFVEVDMVSIGPYAHKFAGPPKLQKA